MGELFRQRLIVSLTVQVKADGKIADNNPRPGSRLIRRR
jgi:hypothetical protein